jgi:hypothetical protein
MRIRFLHALVDVTDAGSAWASSCVGGTTEARFAVPPMADLVIDNRDLTAEELQELIKK